MASQHNDTVLDHDLDDDDESLQSQDEDDDLENDDVLPDEDEDEDLPCVSPSSTSVPTAVPSSSVVTVAVNDPSITVTEPTPGVKRQRVGGDSSAIAQQEEKKPQQLDESRRLFQRLWTDEDEIELLRGFLDYSTQRGGSHHDTALFYDQIKSKLQLDFNKNQLVEKLRRLKKKYRNVVNRMSSGKDFSFKSPHDQATFEISRKIWNTAGRIAVEDGNLDDDDTNPNPSPNLNYINGIETTPRSRKRVRPRSSIAAPIGSVKIDEKRFVNDGFAGSSDHNNGSSSNSNVIISGLIEGTVRSCLPQLIKEFLGNGLAGGSWLGRGLGGVAMNAIPLSFGGGEMMVDEKWRRQQILELEVYSKRLELVQDQIKAQLEELRSVMDWWSGFWRGLIAGKIFVAHGG
ncbi:hypothetical protein K2173_022179 [Erythroxylum novogranatense]|uniref:Glabrous enhancer-binding protein-like DBD domain-containing protein n=1 Tax=Erythroxylum novogranatense TaxID=1862640 RepID=A0AAV8TYN8_9ROSI|nr:hypothetical protein K2173_022179 [Erythroxylum novogranatense]